MDMKQPLAYFESALNDCKFQADNIDFQIAELKAKQSVFREIERKLEKALDKERKKAAGEIEW